MNLSLKVPGPFGAKREANENFLYIEWGAEVPGYLNYLSLETSGIYQPDTRPFRSRDGSLCLTLHVGHAGSQNYFRWCRCWCGPGIPQERSPALRAFCFSSNTSR